LTTQPFQFGPYVYVRGEDLEDLPNGFEGWIDNTYEALQEAENTNIISYDEELNTVIIRFTETGSNDVTYYTIYKFIVCSSSVYLCTSVIENLLRDDYQDEIDYSTASFGCALQ
jgi:hypothetical protein